MRNILRSSAFRRVAAASAAFSLVAFMLFAFIYWQTAVLETRRIERLIEQQSATIARAPTERIPGRSIPASPMTCTGLLSARCSIQRELLSPVILGALPASLPLDGHAHRLDAAQLDLTRSDDEPVIAVGRRLPDGRVVILGRVVDQLAEMRSVVTRALALGVIPALFLALAFGMLLGHRTNQRIKSMQAVLDRVRRGQLAERLPTRGSGDDFDQLRPIYECVVKTAEEWEL